jgi:hypothetical protein
MLRLWRVLPSVWFVTPSRARIDATAGTLASYAFIFRDAFTVSVRRVTPWRVESCCGTYG